MGTWHRHDAENRAFVSFARHFREKGLPVPEILAENLAEGVYLQEDLGDLSLLDLWLEQRRGLPAGEWPEQATAYYRQSLRELARLQVTGGEGLDWNLCQHGSVFDRQGVLFDLYYFKYYFLKPHKVDFDEQSLERDFEALANYLLEGPSDFFLYRDFQARNILVKDGRVRFIDFQGGKKGPLGYDVASLLDQAKADLPEALRESLLDGYLAELRQWTSVDEADFRARYRGFVLLRGLQVLV
jgi:aminoglycoside/choline kinase family phosphotransferase